MARGKPIIVESNSDFKTCLNVGHDQRKIVRLEVNVFIFFIYKTGRKNDRSNKTFLSCLMQRGRTRNLNWMLILVICILGVRKLIKNCTV